MQALAQNCERIAATTRKSEKIAILADYFRVRQLSHAVISAIFLSGQAFPAFEQRTLQVGGSLLWKVVAEFADVREGELSAAYRRRGDLGSATYDVLASRTNRKI